MVWRGGTNVDCGRALQSNVPITACSIAGTKGCGPFVTQWSGPFSFSFLSSFFYLQEFLQLFPLFLSNSCHLQLNCCHCVLWSGEHICLAIYLFIYHTICL